MSRLWGVWFCWLCQYRPWAYEATIFLIPLKPGFPHISTFTSLILVNDPIRFPVKIPWSKQQSDAKSCVQMIPNVHVLVYCKIISQIKIKKNITLYPSLSNLFSLCFNKLVSHRDWESPAIQLGGLQALQSDLRRHDVMGLSEETGWTWFSLFVY